MDSSSNLILNIALAIIMFGMGLGLKSKDFSRIFKEPKAILLGLINQIVCLPVLAFVIVISIPMPIEIAIGLMILSVCPGGASSNLITLLARADLALSVSLTSLSSFITVLTIPFIINLSFQFLADESQRIHLDVLETILKIFTVTILPIIIGMLVNLKAVEFAKRMEKPVRLVSALLLVLIIIGLMIKERSNLAQWFADAGLIALLLNLLSISVGFFSAKLLKLSFKQALSICIEVGIQNGTLAIAIAIVLIGNSAYAVTPAIYSLIMFFVGAFIIFFAKKKIP